MWQTGSAAKGVEDLETGEELLVIGGRNEEDVEGMGPSPVWPQPLVSAAKPPKRLRVYDFAIDSMSFQCVAHA